MGEGVHDPSRSRQARPHRVNGTIVLGIVGLIASADIFTIAAEVVGMGNAALATTSLVLVGVILLVAGIVGSRH